MKPLKLKEEPMLYEMKTLVKDGTAIPSALIGVDDDGVALHLHGNWFRILIIPSLRQHFTGLEKQDTGGMRPVYTGEA